MAADEDEHGRLRAVGAAAGGGAAAQRAARAAAAAAAAAARVRRGMLRYVELVVDLSRAAAATDMRPLRAAVMSGVVQQFVRSFFDENPLSQLGLIVMRNGVAERLTELSTAPEVHIAKLRSNLDTGGDASLQNALDLTVASLRTIPPYGHREVLILFAALSTCDPGTLRLPREAPARPRSIMDSVKAAKEQRVRVSVVGLAAEVRICRVMCDQTGGTYGVALNEAHLEQLVNAHAVPPPAAPGSTGTSLVHMGFPSKAPEAPGAASFVGEECVLRAGGFACPRCAARQAQVPAQCHVCGLMLVSSAHLARSYHHLFPVQPFPEVDRAQLVAERGCGGKVPDLPPPNEGGGPYCYGCCRPLLAPSPQSPQPKGRARGAAPAADAAAAAEGVVLRCRRCRNLFCFDCDVFIHSHLHNCPGCECLPPGAGEEDEEPGPGRPEPEQEDGAAPMATDS
eukprot:scaffold9.g3194.t1